MSRHGQPYKVKGLAAAAAVITAWAALLVFLLTVDLEGFPVWLVPPAMLLMTFLYVGMFITAHDAMHGSVLPGRAGVNRGLGTVYVTLYAMFSYGRLFEKHWEHHRHPGTDKDPDYHDGVHEGFFAWYANFMGNYLRAPQLIGMAIAFNVLWLLLGLELVNIILFWIVPSFASTFQLFYFGTYRVHREPSGGYTNDHHATSNDYSSPVSFLTCYHFGYHLEHHMYPGMPWWRLPWTRRRVLAGGDVGVREVRVPAEAEYG
jgi:beta-carotene ketolase (CrtW type)